MSESSVEAAVSATFHDEWGRLVATLIGSYGDWGLAEECAQDAFERALERWPSDGIPDNPGAWLTTVARRRALDRLRRAKTETVKYEEMGTLSPGEPVQTSDGAIADDRLRLLFTCCHPALSMEAQVALTLRTLTGLTTAEIARAFLVDEQTMAKRLVRAKKKIRNAGIPYRVPPDYLLPERTAAVLGVLYLLFNEGYSATSGVGLVRPDLSNEAIRLGRLLLALMPDEPEAIGALALMLLQDSRRGARLAADGTLIPLEEQDRRRWDQVAIGEGLDLLDRALRRGRPGPYQLQAAIAACHASAASASETNWAEIAGLYGRLAKLAQSPVVELNRAVAVGMARGPEAGLALVDALAASETLRNYHLLPATRADLLRRLDRRDEAAISYRQAIELAHTDVERTYFRRRLAEIGRPGG